MLGMMLVTADRSHIALELLTSARRPAHGAACCRSCTHAVMAAACAYAAVQSFDFRAAASPRLGQTSMALGMPMLIPHSALVVGFGGTAIIALMLLVRDVARRSSARARKGGRA